MPLACFGYRLLPQALGITFLGVTVRRIPYWNIESAVRGPRGKIAEVWTILRWWGIISLRKKRGWIRHVTIAPKRPDDFLKGLQHRMASSQG